MSDRAFSELRTRQQLGYIVRARSAPLGETPTVLLIVQSLRSPAELWPRMRAFLASFDATLGTLDDAELREAVHAANVSLHAPDLTMRGAADRMWAEVRSGRGRFTLRADQWAVLEQCVCICVCMSERARERERE